MTPDNLSTKDSVFESVIPYANPPDSYHGWDIDLSIVNKTSYGGNEYKENVGKFGEGVVKFLKSNQSLKSALEEIQKWRRNGLIKSPMMRTSVEFMFFTNNIKTGLIYTFNIRETFMGKLQIKKDV